MNDKEMKIIEQEWMSYVHEVIHDGNKFSEVIHPQLTNAKIRTLQLVDVTSCDSIFHRIDRVENLLTVFQRDIFNDHNNDMKEIHERFLSQGLAITQGMREVFFKLQAAESQEKRTKRYLLFKYVTGVVIAIAAIIGVVNHEWLSNQNTQVHVCPQEALTTTSPADQLSGEDAYCCP
jgi:hypothetical protein